MPRRYDNSPEAKARRAEEKRLKEERRAARLLARQRAAGNGQDTAYEMRTQITNGPLVTIGAPDATFEPPAVVAAPSEPVDPWFSRPTLVTEEDLPFASPWYRLFADIHKRLEQTPRHSALCYTLRNDIALDDALDTLQREFAARLGLDAVELIADVTPDGDCLLYARRGPHYRRVAVDRANKIGRKHPKDWQDNEEDE